MAASAWTPVDEPASQWTPVEEPKPSAASRLGTNFLSGLGVTSNEQAKNFFEHPLDTVIKSFEAQGELAKKARDAYDKGDYMGALQHGLNYLVPFIGQQTDQAGEQLKEGDIAGGIGRTLGVAAPIVAGSPEVRAGAANAAGAAGEAGARAVRAGARGANTVVQKAPGSIGATAGAAIGRATGLPGASELLGAAGYGVGRELLPNLRIPGEGFGLPSRVTGGPGPGTVPLRGLMGDMAAAPEPVTEPAGPAWTGNLEEKLAAQVAKIQAKEAKAAVKAAKAKAAAGDYTDILRLSVERAKKAASISNP